MGDKDAKRGRSIARLAYELAMVVLQSEAYATPDTRDLVDNILAATDYGRET